jgi:hypothetical protein
VSLIAKDLAKQARIPAYLVTAYMALGSFLDILVSRWPVLGHDLRWRLTFESAVTGASGTEMLAVLLFVAFAWAAADHFALAVGFAVALITGVLYLCGGAIFVLDVLQVRGQVTADQVSRYQVGAAWTLGRMLFTGSMLLLLAVLAFRGFRSLTRAADRGVTAPNGSLLVSKAAATPNRASV